MSHKSESTQAAPLFLRDQFCTTSFWGIPYVERCTIIDYEMQPSSYSEKAVVKPNERPFLTLHFFKDDYKFSAVYNSPEQALKQTLCHYKYIWGPDFSLYPSMPLPVQLMNVFKNRWCTTYWQANGLSVIPSVGWSDEASFAFCFEGIPKGSVVCISTVGNYRSDKAAFLKGYSEMQRQLEPALVYCYGKAFEEMDGNVVEIGYKRFGKGGF